jgi:uncharacterized damage-inducible protein DinB
MPALDYLRPAARDLHQSLSKAVAGLTDEQLHFRPLNTGHHIGFAIWHLARTEDIVVNAFLRKTAPVWNSQGWDKRVGIDSNAQGTGMSPEQAAALRISDLGEFVQYMEAVFRATERYLDEVTESDLEVVHDMPMLGKRSLLQTVGGVILQHGANHLGEIHYIKGLQGLKGSPY